MTARINFGKYGDSTVGDVTDAHVMTIAPTGAGKGASSIIPNLLGWPGPALVLDPNGEATKRTLAQRQRLGQTTFVLDPFELTGDGDGIGFNPVDFIDDGAVGVASATGLADALIADGAGRLEAEARDLLKALILYVRSAPEHEDHRNLTEINRLVSFPDQLVGTLDEPGDMLDHPAYDGLVARLARRLVSRPAAETSRVWSRLQLDLGRILDEPRIARSLKASSFDFRQLRQGNTTIYLVLPARFLHTYNGWLRLLVGSALDRLLEGMHETIRPPVPILMVLDEFQHLGALDAARAAYGSARCAGLKLWITIQNLAQLDESFGEAGRESFVANSGSIEIFDLNDNHGCRYFAEKMGGGHGRGPGAAASVLTADTSGSAPPPAALTETGNIRISSPPLRAHEIAALSPNQKILFRRGHGFMQLEKVLYFEHPRLKELAR